MEGTEWLRLAPYLFVGGALGVVHFGGLWWTLRRLPATTRPGRWIGLSFVTRGALTIGGFYLIVGRGWPPTLAAMAGFIAVRLAIGRRLGPPRRPLAAPDKRC